MSDSDARLYLPEEYRYHAKRYYRRDGVTDDDIDRVQELVGDMCKCVELTAIPLELDTILPFKVRTVLEISEFPPTEKQLDQIFSGRQYPSISTVSLDSAINRLPVSHRSKLFSYLLACCPNIHTVRYISDTCLEDFGDFLIKLQPSELEFSCQRMRSM
jgi:hypothetical protein